MLTGLVGLTYSVYLLYTGVPILMHIPEERGFIYASSIVTAGVVLLVSIITSSVILWSHGFGPEFIHLKKSRSFYTPAYHSICSHIRLKYLRYVTLN